jgi:hypothetical protein
MSPSIVAEMISIFGLPVGYTFCLNGPNPIACNFLSGNPEAESFH